MAVATRIRYSAGAWDTVSHFDEPGLIAFERGVTKETEGLTGKTSVYAFGWKVGVDLTGLDIYVTSVGW